MRVVAGRFRGRPLTAPEGLAVRPTADRTREALFNILTQGRIAQSGPALAGSHVLDAFAGSGALGLEALSRGAAHVSFIESHSAAIAALRRNVAMLDVESSCSVLAADVLHPPPPPATAGPCSLVLMDPPYNQGLAAPAMRALDRAGWIAPDALISVELMSGEGFEVPEGCDLLDERRYGKARLLFLRSLSENLAN